jgi:serine/threonine protein kinase
MKESIGETPQSPEELNHTMEELLLSCERAGEGGKAIVLKLSVNDARADLRPALDALQIESSGDDQAIKLFKLYSPRKGAWEYKMHQQAYEAVEGVPEEERGNFASVPKLSSMHGVQLEDSVKEELEKRFSTFITGNETQLIAMEYVDGEDLATMFYKWILEKENRFSPEETDGMNFARLYEEVADSLRFETLQGEVIDDPRALELAEWKNTANNTGKLYDYLRKHHFPFPPRVVSQIENTIKLFHKAHITHGDAFERNIMVTGGMNALRNNGNLEGQRSFIIDFGEAKDHAVEGVDEFAVVRRLKGLTRSPEEEDKMAQQDSFNALDQEAASLSGRDKGWVELVGKVKEASDKSSEQGLLLAWNRTAVLDQKRTSRFFIIAKEGIQEGRFSKEEVLDFVKGKITKASPYEKRMVQGYFQWLDKSSEAA